MYMCMYMCMYVYIQYVYMRTLSPQWCGPTSFLLGPEEATIDASVKNAADFTSSSWSARIFEQCPVSALHTNQVQIHTSSETMKIDMIFDKRLQRRKEQQHTQKITHPLFLRVSTCLHTRVSASGALADVHHWCSRLFVAYRICGPVHLGRCGGGRLQQPTPPNIVRLFLQAMTGVGLGASWMLSLSEAG